MLLEFDNIKYSITTGGNSRNRFPFKLRYFKLTNELISSGRFFSLFPDKAILHRNLGICANGFDGISGRSKSAKIIVSLSLATAVSIIFSTKREGEIYKVIEFTK
jgi:hypothetical protein